MSNTLKFGSGKWAVKEGSTLAYNDTNGNYKPLPFTFDRAGSATRVNKQGLIEVVPNNEPRIDFLNDSKGALLLEPTRNNYLPYSTLDFNGGSKPEGWSIGFGTGTYSYKQLTYKGQKAVKQTQITTGRSYLDTGSISILANTEHTLKIQFILDECVADDNDDIVSFLGFGVDTVYKFSDIDANGVLEVQYNPLSDNAGSIRIGLGCTQDEDGGKSLAWVMPQLEQGSYATSYIPTQGSIGTRVAETCEQTLPSGIIGQTEGVIYVEAKDVADDGNTKMITLNDGGQTNEIRIDFRTLNEIQLVFTVAGNPQAVISTSNYNSLEFNKIAFKYKENDFALWVNGVKVGVDTNGSTNATNVFSVLEFKRGSGLFPFYGSTKNVKLYNKALTDSELQALTS